MPFQVRKLWVTFGHSCYNGSCPTPWDPVSTSAIWYPWCNQVPSGTNLSLHGRYWVLFRKQALSPSLLSKGPAWKYQESAGCSPALSGANWQRTKVQAHVWEHSNVTTIAQPVSPTYINENAILPAPVSYTGTCPWVLSVLSNNVPKSIDFQTKNLKASECPAFW